MLFVILFVFRRIFVAVYVKWVIFERFFGLTFRVYVKMTPPHPPPLPP